MACANRAGCSCALVSLPADSVTRPGSAGWWCSVCVAGGFYGDVVCVRVPLHLTPNAGEPSLVAPGCRGGAGRGLGRVAVRARGSSPVARARAEGCEATRGMRLRRAQDG